MQSTLSQKKLMHIEMTLSGNGKTHLELINRAKANGYQTTLVYISLDNAETAIQRVTERVTKGGHGVESKLIIKRFKQSLENLPIIASRCDQILIYDNTIKMELVYNQVHDKVISNNLGAHTWLHSLDRQIPF
ncbi:zeta toxin family protein [Levilactobacillus namurensis]|uniref:zeta toxin family protein n=1 Tax=Levilactobacillus namurensis TaxID=380393 RepID=UPI0036F3D92E